MWGRIAINDEDVNLYYIAEAAISRISEMCYDVLFDKSFPVTIETLGDICYTKIILKNLHLCYRGEGNGLCILTS